MAFIIYMLLGVLFNLVIFYILGRSDSSKEEFDWDEYGTAAIGAVLFGLFLWPVFILGLVVALAYQLGKKDGKKKPAQSSSGKSSSRSK